MSAAGFYLICFKRLIDFYEIIISGECWSLFKDVDNAEARINMFFWIMSCGM